MATPIDISTSACAWIVAERADAEGLRRIERRRGDQHRREADQRVERGDELRHRRHRDAARDDRADAAAGADRDDEQEPGEEAGRRAAEQRGQDGERHARPCRRDCPAGSSPGATGRAAPG